MIHIDIQSIVFMSKDPKFTVGAYNSSEGCMT